MPALVVSIPLNQGTLIHKNLLPRRVGGPNKLFLFSGLSAGRKKPGTRPGFFLCFFFLLRGGLDDNAFVGELLVDLLGARIAHAQLGLQVRDRWRLVAALHIVAH